MRSHLEFALQHPEAPAQLDPNDPSQAELVQAWNEMYRDFLNRTVDSHFFRFFPNALSASTLTTLTTRN